MTLPPEFSLIARHFLPLAGEGALELGDDAALLTPPPGRTLVLAADAMVAGVHFLPEDPPETIGRKLLRVNLSDLAAMGAAPLGYLMTCGFARGTTDAWIEAFARGLAADQAEFGLSVLGGDTVVTPGPATFSLTILGHVAPGRALRRKGARAGDDVWVSGTIGDGALGLLALTGRLPPDDHLARRYRLPEPRLALGQALAGIAHAAMDVSDGLIGDLAKMMRVSGTSAEIELACVPVSAQASAVIAAHPGALETALTGGDDYEILACVPPRNAAAFEGGAALAGMAVTRIGHVMKGQAAPRVRDASGAIMVFGRVSYSHF